MIRKICWIRLRSNECVKEKGLTNDLFGLVWWYRASLLSYSLVSLTSISTSKLAFMLRITTIWPNMIWKWHSNIFFVWFSMIGPCGSSTSTRCIAEFDGSFNALVTTLSRTTDSHTHLTFHCFFMVLWICVLLWRKLSIF